MTIKRDSASSAPVGLEAGWEDVAEFSADVQDGPLMLLGPFDTPEISTPRLDEQGSGCYRIRVYGRGRDAAYGQAVSEPTEDYLIVSWLAPSAAPETIAAGSMTSNCWIGSTRHILERGTT